MNDEKILAKLEEQIKEGKSLSDSLEIVTDTNYLNARILARERNIRLYDRCMAWRLSSINILERRFGKNSTYPESFFNATQPTVKEGGDFYKENVMLGTGVLKSAHHALNEGLTEDLFYKQELLLFSDLLEQAFEFLEKGHRLASSIYGRIVMETTIREYAKKSNIEKPKFDNLIIELKKKGIILQTFEHSLRANYKIGSMAAHGDEDFNKITDNQIREYLTFIRDKVLTLE